jgi:hypothetical protein
MSLLVSAEVIDFSRNEMLTLVESEIFNPLESDVECFTNCGCRSNITNAFSALQWLNNFGYVSLNQ